VRPFNGLNQEIGDPLDAAQFAPDSALLSWNPALQMPGDYFAIITTSWQDGRSMTTWFAATLGDDLPDATGKP
jgi:hypothetical protein